MTEEEFFSGYSALRNKELMRVFKYIHLVEQLGSGMIRILKKYNRYIFTISPNFIKVTFKFIENVNEGLNVAQDVAQEEVNLQELILKLIKENNKVTRKEIFRQ